MLVYYHRVLGCLNGVMLLFSLSQGNMCAVKQNSSHWVDFIDCGIQLKAPDLAGAQGMLGRLCFSVSVPGHKSWASSVHSRVE